MNPFRTSLRSPDLGAANHVMCAYVSSFVHSSKSKVNKLSVVMTIPFNSAKAIIYYT